MPVFPPGMRNVLSNWVPPTLQPPASKCTTVVHWKIVTRKINCDAFADMIFVKSFTQAYTLTFRNLPEENA